MNDNSTDYTKNYMVPFAKALQLITDNSNELDNEFVNVSESNGRVLAQEIISPLSIPPFNNSAMDGYAVNSIDLTEASKENPVKLKLAGLTAAGDDISSQDKPEGTAWKIMTGAPVPDGYDSIIPVENTKLDGEALGDDNLGVNSLGHDKTVHCFSPTNNGAHVRLSGEDFVKDDLVLSPKAIINANKIMALTSLGIAKIEVKKKPSIAVFSTGKELIDDPNQELKPGQIHNSNMPYILEYLKDLPVTSFNAGTNYDEVDAYEKALKIELNKKVDIIISTGAVSMGDFDFIPQTILKMGGEIIFHKSLIRPGKPVLFARFPNGSFYIGLPGNPISATIGLRFFVSHLITRLVGLPPEKPQACKLVNSHKKKVGFTNILKSNAEIDSTATLRATIMKGQESFKIHPLMDANGWVVLQEQLDSIQEGELVSFFPSTISYNN